MPRCDLCRRPAWRAFLCFEHWARVPDGLRLAVTRARTRRDKLLATGAVMDWSRRQPRECDTILSWPSAR